MEEKPKYRIWLEKKDFKNGIVALAIVVAMVIGRVYQKFLV